MGALGVIVRIISFIRGAALSGALVASLTLSAHEANQLEHGAYLMNGPVACGNCHTPQTPEGPVAGMELAGGTKFEEPGFTAYAPNITPDPRTGIGNWTDDEIVAAIRDGRRPDGSTIGPPMPIALYRGLADEDVRAIVAYMRTVKPAVNEVARSHYHIPLPSYGPPVKTVAAAPRSDKIVYGAYLAGPLAHCIECHSGPGPNGTSDFIKQLGAGGMVFHGPWGESRASNITPNGIGHYSDADIKRAITKGVRPDGSALMPPMAYHYYQNISASDLDDIVAYLRTLEPK